jgi:hypothetical protein
VTKRVVEELNLLGVPRRWRRALRSYEEAPWAAQAGKARKVCAKSLAIPDFGETYGRPLWNQAHSHGLRDRLNRATRA